MQNPISFRLDTETSIGQWATQKHNNKNKTNCDFCGERLWVAPDGSLYCNEVHTQREIADVILA